jgi:exonuclease SbcD
MRFLHTGDLHLGRKINGYSCLPQQKKTLDQIVTLVTTYAVDAVLIAGDVYDKPVPVVEAVTLFDAFLTALAQKQVAVFAISGNHDSPERLQFGSALMHAKQIHIAGRFDGTLPKVVMQDAYGPVNVYMLPFARYSAVMACLPKTSEQELPETLGDALAQVIDASKISPDERNLLLYHGFVLADHMVSEIPEASLQLGGVQRISSSIFAPFDYTALGHIHKPQWIEKQRIRYSGSILKYAFPEAAQTKSVTLVTLGKKGDLSTEIIPLPPEQDMRVLRGPFSEILAHAEPSEDLIRVELTDETVVAYALEQLRVVYPHVLELAYLQQAQRIAASTTETEAVPNQTVEELVTSFLQSVYHFDVTESPETETLLREIIQEVQRT